MENPQEPSASSSETRTAELPSSDTSASQDLPIEPALVSPEVERLAPCEGAAKRIVEPTTAGRPSPAFLAVVAIVSLVSDVGSKLWAEAKLEGYPGTITVWENHLAFVLAKNRGGAWGLLQGTNENVRRPFFLLVSAAAIAFIVTLYRRLQPRQRALKWGLPLVLGGALGNVFDRIRYGHVIDFIDYRADWIRVANEFVAKHVQGHIVTDHWPTFNVADVAICVGVGLMAVDMFTAKRRSADGRTIPPPPPAPDVLDGGDPSAASPPGVTVEGAAPAAAAANDAAHEDAGSAPANEDAVAPIAETKPVQ